MSSSSTKETILRELGRGAQTGYGLSNATGLPQPSVRRTIGTLRREGYDIVSTGRGWGAEYHLERAAVSQADGYAGDAFDTDIDAGDETTSIVDLD